MGDSNVGKSCLIKRYCEEKFISKYIPTIGVDYGVKPVKYGDYEVRVNLWDMAGPAEYLEVRNEFYKDAQGALLIYDITNRASFESITSWVEESKKYGAPDMVIFVAGTKADVPGRKVSEKEGRDWAAAQGFAFFEVSSFSGQRVRSLFTSMFARMLATIPGVPQDLIQLAVQEAAQARGQEEELEGGGAGT